jgi:hypothetical protein
MRAKIAKCGLLVIMSVGLTLSVCSVAFAEDGLSDVGCSSGGTFTGCSNTGCPGSCTSQDFITCQCS